MAEEVAEALMVVTVVGLGLDLVPDGLDIIQSKLKHPRPCPKDSSSSPSPARTAAHHLMHKVLWLSRCRCGFSCKLVHAISCMMTRAILSQRVDCVGAGVECLMYVQVPVFNEPDPPCETNAHFVRFNAKLPLCFTCS